MKQDDNIDSANRGIFSLMSVGEVADALNCSVRHVYRLFSSGRMPRPVRLGGLVRWPTNSIKAWIDAGCPQCDEGGRR